MRGAADGQASGDETLVSGPSVIRRGEELQQGHRVGRYVVLGRVGAGGMGVVYAAFDPELDRKVAIKLLHTDDEKSRSRALREAQAMAKLSHPNVVTVHDVGEHAGSVYVAMEFVDGTTLTRWQREVGRDWRRILAAYVQAGRGLAAAHQQGLVHRDFKPDNAMVDSSGRVRVLDFGLAKTTDSEDAPSVHTGSLVSTLLTEGELLGTPAYMAPEQHLRKDVGPAADQFAFCVAAWEALFGQRPHTGSSPAALVAAIVAGTVAPPPASNVPRAVRKALMRGLAAEPRERWPSVGDLLAELERGQLRRRRAQIGAAAAVVVVAAAGVWGARQLERARLVEACAQEGTAIETTWNDDARSSVRGGLLASGAPDAESAAERTLPRLDAYAEGWSRVRSEACENHRVAQAWDADIENRAAWCLEIRRFAFAELIAELSSATAPVVEQAVRAASSIEAPEACTDRVHLDRLPTPPTEQREQVLAVMRRLATADVLRATGSYARGHEIATEALAAAQNIGWAPLTARAEWTVGAVALRTGDLDAAEANLESAYFRAVESGASDTAVETAEALAVLVGVLRARPDEGMRWSRQAAAISGSLPTQRESDRALHLLNVGKIHRERGDLDAAQRAFEESLAIYTETLGENHPSTATALQVLASLRTDMGAHEEAIALHHRWVAIAEATIGPEHPDTARGLVNLATAHEVSGEYDEALALYDRALPILKRSMGDDRLEVVQVRSNVGNILLRTGKNDEAREVFESTVASLKETVGPNHPFVAMALTNLAVVDESDGEYARAVERYTEALEIFRTAVGEEHPHYAQTLSNLGNAHRSNGDIDRARELYERALTVQEATLGSKHPGVAATLVGLAEVHLAQNRAAEAVAPAERAVAIFEAVDVPESNLRQARSVLERARAAARSD